MGKLQTRDLVFLIALSVPSIICIGHLWWRRKTPWWKRALWSLPLIVPIIGPLLYPSLFRGLARNESVPRPVVGQSGVPIPDVPDIPP
jgi:hypothetical protein